MTEFGDRPADYQRRRWMRPNAHLYIRQDGHRVMPPGSPRGAGRDVVRYFWPDPGRSPPPTVSDAEVERMIAAERERLLGLKSELAAIKAELKFAGCCARASTVPINPACRREIPMVGSGRTVVARAAAPVAMIRDAMRPGARYAEARRHRL